MCFIAGKSMVSVAQDDFQLLCGRDAASMRQLAGYGFGLPLSRVYAQCLGASFR